MIRYLIENSKKEKLRILNVHAGKNDKYLLILYINNRRKDEKMKKKKFGFLMKLILVII